MKRRLLSVILIALTASFLQGQTQTDYYDFLKSGIKISSKQIIFNALDLTQSEKENFNKVFDTYFKKRSEIAKERLPILVEYAANKYTMPDDELIAFNAYLIKSNKQLARLNKRFYNKARKVIPIKKATAFFLIEKFLRNEVENEIIDGGFILY